MRQTMRKAFRVTVGRFEGYFAAIDAKGAIDAARFYFMASQDAPVTVQEIDSLPVIGAATVAGISGRWV